MARTLVLAALRHPDTPLEALRMLLVHACALTLIGAGPFLPAAVW